MEISVQHTAKDHLEAHAHVTRRMFSESPIRYVFTFLSGGVGLFLTASLVLLGQFLDRYSGKHGEYVTFAIGSLLVALFLSFISSYVYKRLAYRCLFRQGGYGTSVQRFAIEQDGLVHCAGRGYSRVSWCDVEAVEKTPRFIFAFLDRGLALYISRRAFSDDKAYESFFDAMKLRVDAGGALGTYEHAQ